MGPIPQDQERFPHAHPQGPFPLTKLRQREERWGRKRRYQRSQELESQRRKQVRWRETEEALSSTERGKTVSTDTDVSPGPSPAGGVPCSALLSAPQPL